MISRGVRCSRVKCSFSRKPKDIANNEGTAVQDEMFANAGHGLCGIAVYSF